MLATLFEKDRAAATEDMSQINQELDEHLNHLNDLRDTIQGLIDLPDFELNRKDTDRYSRLDISLLRDKQT